VGHSVLGTGKIMCKGSVARKKPPHTKSSRCHVANIRSESNRLGSEACPSQAVFVQQDRSEDLILSVMESHQCDLNRGVK
jgi:hypothetical protein